MLAFPLMRPVLLSEKTPMLRLVFVLALVIGQFTIGTRSVAFFEVAFDLWIQPLSAEQTQSTD